MSGEKLLLYHNNLTQSLGELGVFRLRYRNEIRVLIAEIVSGSLSSEQARILINKKVVELPIQDHTRFVETANAELLSLHKGDCACYRIKPLAFRNWKAIWNKS